MVTRWAEARRDHQHGNYHKGGYGTRYDRPLTPATIRLDMAAVVCFSYLPTAALGTIQAAMSDG